MDGISLGEWLKVNGPWAVLFVALLGWVLRTSESREKRLMEMLDKLAEKYNIIIEEVGAIKHRLFDHKKEEIVSVGRDHQ